MKKTVNWWRSSLLQSYCISVFAIRQMTVATACMIFTAMPALADELTPLSAPADRPYPYQVLDIQPGQIATKAIPQIEEHLGGPLSPIIMQQVVTSPTGRQFKADLTTGYKTTAVSLYTTMGDEPFESVTLTTTTPVLEGRITRIFRRIRHPNTELPEPAELFAQLATLYGEPSWLVIDRHEGARLRYVWTESGQMPPQAEEPCAFIDPNDGYQFKAKRQQEEYPECPAVFEVTYSSKAGQPSISFNLADLELSRLDRAETDRQIMQQLESNTVQPSDMKL